MKTIPLLALMPLTLVPVATNYASAQAPQAVSADAGEGLTTPAAILSSQVSEIAFSNTLTREEKQKRIGALVEAAINKAIAGLTDSNQIVRVANELTVVAVKVAPGFAATISRAVSSVPAIAKIDGAAASIQASVVETLAGLSAPEVAAPAPSVPKAPAIPEFGGQTSDTVISRFR